MQRRGHRPDVVRPEQPHFPRGRRARAQPASAAAHPDGPGTRRDAVAEPAVDARLGGVQRGEHLPAGGDVVELGPHEGGEQAAAGVVGAHPDLGDGGRVEHGAAGHGHPAGVGRGRADERLARVDAPRPVGLVGRGGAGPTVVVERRVQQRAEEQVSCGAEFVDAEDPRLVAQVGLPTS